MLPFTDDGGPVSASGEGPHLRDFGPEAKLRYEWELLDLWLTMHPAETRRGRELAEGTVSTLDLPRLGGRRVGIVGVPLARRRVRTRRGETMMFLTLEDARGVAECTLFPPVYRRFLAAARSEGLIRVWGRVEDQYGAVTLTVSSLEVSPLFPRA